METYDVLDISRYIINYVNDENKKVSNLQLQKILYYVQANFLVKRNYPCFSENIVNWTYGPVVEEVYREYRIHGYSHIPYQKKFNTIKYNAENNSIELQEEEFTKEGFEEEDLKLIEEVVDSFIECDAFELVEKTHSEAPWKNTCQNDVISEEYIKKYYLDNIEKLKGKN